MKRWLLRIVVGGVGLLVFLLILRGLLFHGPRTPPQPIEGSFLVDLHCHTAGLGARGSGCFVSQDLRNSYKFGIYLDAFGVTEQALKDEGDGAVIRKLADLIEASEAVDAAVVLALDGVVDASGILDRDRTQLYVPNEFVAAEVKEYDQLYFGASVHPRRPDALKRLEWCVAEGAVLLKWIPSIQKIDPADPALEPFFRALAEHELPLLTHTGNERSFVTANDSLSDPARLEQALKLGVTVIAAHVATTGKNHGERNEQRLIPLMKYPNLYAGVSSLTQINKRDRLDWALSEERFRGRLVFGTDYPLINTMLVSAWYYPLHLSFAEMRRIEAIENPFDRNVRLKQALGIRPEIFARTATVLGLPR